MRRFLKGRSGLAVAFAMGIVIALAGSATGATRLITGKQIKNGSITAKDLSKSLRAQLKKAGTPGTNGAAGAKGDTGAPGGKGDPGTPGADGSAVAYAHVNLDGTLDTAHSKNITSSSKATALAYYCVHPSVPVKHVIATLDFYNGEISASFADNFTSCSAGDAIIRTFTSAGSDANPGPGAFWVLFN
jgi:hypothetical protein